MMFRTNILAIVGGGQKPKFATNKVILWDDLRASQGIQGKVGELSFKTYVKAVRLTKDKVVVVLLASGTERYLSSPLFAGAFDEQEEVQ